MLENGTERGFSQYELDQLWDQEIIGQDEEGYYVHSAYENSKVYFEDFYQFLEKIEAKCLSMIESANWSISQEDKRDRITELYAEKLILLKVLELIRNHYGFYQGLEFIAPPQAFAQYAIWNIESIEENIPQDRLEGNRNVAEVLEKVKEIYGDILGEILEEFIDLDEDDDIEEQDEKANESYFNQLYFE